MGLRDELQADLAEAFSTDLADAVMPFTGTYTVPGAWDPVTETDTSVEATYTGRGVLGKYETRRIDNINILSSDLKLTALTNEVTDRPAEGHTIKAPDLADRTQLVSYLVKAVQVDPASATFRIQLSSIARGAQVGSMGFTFGTDDDINIGTTWNFPMPFLGAPNVMVNFAAGELAVRKPFNGPGAVSRTATNCSVSLWSQGAFVQADVDGVIFSVVAVGRWK